MENLYKNKILPIEPREIARLEYHLKLQELFLVIRESSLLAVQKTFLFDYIRTLMSDGSTTTRLSIAEINQAILLLKQPAPELPPQKF